MLFNSEFSSSRKKTYMNSSYTEMILYTTNRIQYFTVNKSTLTRISWLCVSVKTLSLGHKHVQVTLHYYSVYLLLPLLTVTPCHIILLGD
jgi:hypothetical protein